MKFVTLSFLSLVTAMSFAASAADKTYDAQFLDKMTEHHRQGVEMAEMGKEKATNPKLKKMSEKMVKEQKKEISEMEKWRKKDFANEPAASDLPPKMDMDGLKSASGTDFDHAYIDMMSKHHEDGINMAKDAESNAATSKVKSFAKKIVKNQTSEKEEMSKLHTASH
jgi:uncharacterized protein (DUF305 family)